jgi:ankyrin repeat protein
MDLSRTCRLSAVGFAALLLSGTAAWAADIAGTAMRGDDAALKGLVSQKGVDVDAPDADGATALQWAVYNDDLDMAKLLVSKGANVMAKNREGMMPLDLAAVNGNPAMIKMLVAAGADVNATMTNGETPLMMAARTGRVDAMQVLVDKGADINAKETLRGTNALMWAAAYSRPEAVQFLIKHGADLSAKSADTGRGRRPYLAPSALSRIQEAKLGVGQGGRSIAVDLKGDAGKDLEKEVQADVAQGAGGGTSGGDLQALEKAQAAKLKAQAEARKAAAADEKKKAEAASNVDADDPGSFDSAKDAKGGGLTALVFATRQGDMQSVKYLVEAGADVNEVTEFGWSPLLTATQNRYYQIGKYLLDHGADPNIANKGGWSPLYIATDNRNIEGGDYPVRKADMDHLEFIKLLLDKGADPNLRMKSSTETRTIFTNQWLHEEGATPFLRAAQSGDLTLMKILLAHGADPNIATDEGVTPLMVASGIGWVEGITYQWSHDETIQVIKLLLDLGNNVNAQDHVDYRTALMGAAHKGDVDAIQLLVDHGADMEAHDLGSRDTIHKLAGVTWQAIDYADGLVRVGVQSAEPHPEASALLRKLMTAKGLKVPPAGRTLDSICITKVCQ